MSTVVRETPAQQRQRILNATAPDTEPWMYDLAVALGYEPESWDGMWKLLVHPFSFQHGCVIAREVVYSEGHKTIALPDNTIKTRLVAHKLPEGWQVTDDRRLIDTEPRYCFVSPRDLALLRSIPNF